MIQLNWYKIFGVQIPDGSTVLPTDDIQIWLHCANIWDKSYTTLAEVLADTTTLSALISSNNAVDYMVRSTSWAGISLVPAMTSNTTPSGECLSSGEYSTNYNYRGFDGNDSTDWASTQGTVGDWLGYKFTSPCAVGKVSIKNANRVTKLNYEISDDGVTWTTKESNVSISLTAVSEFSVSSPEKHLYSRVVSTEKGGGVDRWQIYTLQFYSENLCADSTAMTYIGLNNYCANKLLKDATWCNAICNSTYFESVLNVKVPVMTSNTTPSGECFVDQTASWFEPYYFFDGNTSRHGGWAQNSYPHWFAYDFGRAVTIVGFEWYAYAHYGGRTIPMLLEYSDDKSTWNSYGDTVNAVQSVSWSAMATHISGAHRYWRIYCATQGTADSIAFGEVQFYGREDV